MENTPCDSLTFTFHLWHNTINDTNENDNNIVAYRFESINNLLKIYALSERDNLYSACNLQVKLNWIELNFIFKLI